MTVTPCKNIVEYYYYSLPLKISKTTTIKTFDAHWTEYFDPSITLSTESALSRTHPMIDAALCGNCELIRHFNQRDATLLHLGDYAGLTALFWAVIGNQLEAADTLIELGADVNVAGNRERESRPGKYIVRRGATCLWVACMEENPAMIKFLLKQGAVEGIKLYEKNQRIFDQAKSELLRELAEEAAQIRAVLTQSFPLPKDLLSETLEYLCPMYTQAILAPPEKVLQETPPAKKGIKHAFCELVQKTKKHFNFK